MIAALALIHGDELIPNLREIESQLNQQEYMHLDDLKLQVPASASGFYWIYTKLNIQRFLESPDPINPKHVNFRQLSSVHKGSKYVVQQKEDEYWCIYNGKGKQLKNRIVAEFSNTSGKTGTLALSRCFQATDFRIKYVMCDNPNNSKGILPVYSCLERDIERVWRLNNGWPLLCRT